IRRRSPCRRRRREREQPGTGGVSWILHADDRSRRPARGFGPRPRWGGRGEPIEYSKRGGECAAGHFVRLRAPKEGANMTYKGSCHCGRVGFEVDGELGRVIECNCSHCSRKGYLLWFVPQERLRLLTPRHELSVYTFNKH